MLATSVTNAPECRSRAGCSCTFLLFDGGSRRSFRGGSKSPEERQAARASTGCQPQAAEPPPGSTTAPNLAQRGQHQPGSPRPVVSGADPGGAPIRISHPVGSTTALQRGDRPVRKRAMASMVYPTIGKSMPVMPRTAPVGDLRRESNSAASFSATNRKRWPPGEPLRRTWLSQRRQRQTPSRQTALSTRCCG